MNFCETFVSYRSTPDHSHPSPTSCPTVQALQYTILNSHVLGGHSFRIKTQNIDDINGGLVNIFVKFYVSGRVPRRTFQTVHYNVLEGDWAPMNENSGIEQFDVASATVKDSGSKQKLIFCERF